MVNFKMLDKQFKALFFSNNFVGQHLDIFIFSKETKN